MDTFRPVIVIGGGQAGLSISYYLTKMGIDHLILEKNRMAHSWREERWDNFCLVTPNWQCMLPDFPYKGDDPKGFMAKDDIVAYVEDFANSFDAPIEEGIEVSHLSHDGELYQLKTSAGDYSCEQVVIAIGGYHKPMIPGIANALPASIEQIHSSQYKRPEDFTNGDVLVVGSGQSGCQIAEDLHLAGHKVHLCVGSAPRVARRYRGKDVVEWLDDMDYYDMPVEKHPLKEEVRKRANHYVTGRDGGRDIDLRQRALEGMQLYGRLETIEQDKLHFKADLAEKLDSADEVSENIKKSIDKFIAENGVSAPEEAPYEPVWAPDSETAALSLEESNIRHVIWSIGFLSDFSWIDVSIFDQAGYPKHQRGVTEMPGLYFIGLPWLHTWGSGRFSGVARDAAYLAEHVKSLLATEKPGVAMPDSGVAFSPEVSNRESLMAGTCVAAKSSVAAWPDKMSFSAMAFG